MPTGTGKTVCLLALLTAYLSNRDKYKRVYLMSDIVSVLYKDCCGDGEDARGIEECVGEEEGRREGWEEVYVCWVDCQEELVCA